MNPKISAIVPVYNVERYLARCLDSLVGQTLRQIEIICVDDGSRDRSPAILADYAARDSRVRVITQENKRQGGARNTGLDASSGQWVAFIDSDDWVCEDYFERLLAAAMRHGAEIACANVEKHRGSRRKWNVYCADEVAYDALQEKFDACHCPPNFNTTNKLYLREALVRSGIRFREHAVYEDVEFMANVLAALGRVVTVPGAVYHYMVHDASTTKSCQSLQKQLDKYNAHKAFVAFADAHGLRFGRHFRDVRRRRYRWAGISWVTMRDNGRREALKLFDFLPLWHRKPRK